MLPKLDGKTAVGVAAMIGGVFLVFWGYKAVF
jgi:hypothetical protein